MLNPIQSLESHFTRFLLVATMGVLLEVGNLPGVDQYEDGQVTVDSSHGAVYIKGEIDSVMVNSGSPPNAVDGGGRRVDIGDFVSSPPPSVPADPFAKYRCNDGSSPSGSEAQPCIDNIFANPPDPDPTPEVPVEPGITVVSARDVVSFVPPAPQLVTQPDRAALVGAPMNCVYSASGASVPGVLFGHGVVVAFTPVAAHLDFGDGSAIAAPVSNGEWSVEYTPTDASHAYAERGQFTASLVVEYSAVATFDTGQVLTVAGSVFSAPSILPITVVKAYTALVAS